ncbi:MAG TPA: GIY-YIG nuclease family protein [Ignavibacteria bacterium]
MNRLLNTGFINVGYWTLKNDSIQYHLISHQKTENVLYCFVTNGVIMYIGKTTIQLTKRMYGYQNPGLSQRTNIRVNDKIRTLLTKEQPLDILILVDNGLLKYSDFRINLAAGLEDTLIYEISPEWNFSGKNKIKEDKNSDTEKLLEINKPTTLKNTTTDTFEVVLGHAYYNQGFFNVRILHSDDLGADKEEIAIQLGDNPKKKIKGYINRTANSNGTPRIMGGKLYTEWIKNNFRQKDNLTVDILTPVSIRLNEKITTTQKIRQMK